MATPGPGHGSTGQSEAGTSLQETIGRSRQALATSVNEEQYGAVRDALTAALTAQPQGSTTDLFEGWTVAARCAVAAAKASAVPAQDNWYATAFRDLASAARVAAAEPAPAVAAAPGAQPGPERMAEFALVAATLFEESETRYWPDVAGADLEAWLQALAAALDKVEPAALTIAGDTRQTVWLLRTLARLAYRHGRSSSGDARSDCAMQTALEAGNLRAWLEAAYDRYQVLRAGNRAARDIRNATSLADLEALVRRATGPEERARQLGDLLSSFRHRAEAFRRRYRSRAGRLWAAQILDPMLGTLLQDTLGGQDLDAEEVFAGVEGMKARLLLDYLDTTYQDFASPASAAQAVAQERQVLGFAAERGESDLLHDEMRLSSQLTIGTYFDRDEREVLLDPIERIYAAEQAGFYGGTIPYPLRAVGAALEPGEALIEYCMPYEELRPAGSIHILILTNDGIRLARAPELRSDGPGGFGFIGRLSVDGRQPLDASPLGQEVIGARMAIQDGREEDATAYLRTLYDLLIAPVIAEGVRPQDFRRWILVPSGMLHSVPFPALVAPEGRRLIDEVALTWAPSAATWYSLQSRRAAPASSFLGFADPLLLSARWPPLPAAAAEVETICQELAPLPCTVYSGTEATEEMLRNTVAGKSLVHLATHGDFPESDVIDLHRVLLAPSAGNDGRLHAEELRRMDLSQARLVVLSICDGGLHRIGPGDEPYGLIPALLTAEAQNVLGTLWPVEDNAGRAFTVEFYKHLLAGGPAEAYRQACMQRIHDGAPLSDWAGWILFGPGRPIT